METTCDKCKSICTIDGDPPKFFAWCDVCNDYAEGFDPLEYASEREASLVDYIYDKIRDDGILF